MYDPYSPSGWEFEGHGSVEVGDLLFDDSQLKWMCLNEITLEPVTGDPMETRLEPVFWLYNKDLTCELQLSESEMIPYLGG